jgi:hypothetical protein
MGHTNKSASNADCNTATDSTRLLLLAAIMCIYTNALKSSGHYMYHQFNIQQFHVLPTQCIYIYCVDLRTNSDYFPVQH